MSVRVYGRPAPKFIYHLSRSCEGTGGYVRYDEATDMVVIAPDSRTARKVAALASRDEGADVWLNGRRSGQPFARIRKIGTAERNPNGSTPKDRVVVCDGAWAG